MRTTPKKSPVVMRRSVGRGLVLLAALALIVSTALTAPAPRGPQSERMQGMGLTYDSLDAILKDLAVYKFDQGVGAPLALRAYVFAHKNNPAERTECEAKLIAFLQASPAPGGTMAACRALRLMGSAAAVPVLESMLLSADRTDPARYALEKIPGAEADNALLRTLDKAQGDIKRGIIFSIGERRIAGAVPALEKLAAGGDASFAGDAVKALGKIGTAEAARALTAAFDKSSGAQKGGVASALMLCAEARIAENKNLEAAGLYDKLLKAGLPDVLKQAAFRGRVVAAGEDARGFILDALAGKDVLLYEPAIGLIPQAFSGMNVREVFGALPKLPEDRQVQLVAALGRFPGNAVRDVVVQAAGSSVPPVRIGALRALERVGNGTVVPLLAERSAGSTGDEQAAARETLARVNGLDVDDKIVEMLSGPADAKVKAELVQAVAERRIGAAKPALMELARNSEPAVRLKAIRALSEIAAPADLRDLLSLLFAIDDEAAREQMQDSVAAVARTIPRPLMRGNAAEALLPGEKDPKRRVDLLRVLGKIGDDTALPLVRKALADPDKDVADAAVRALADWPDVQARDDVLAVAGSTSNLTHKVLALRAYVRMIGLEPYLRPESAVADLEKVLALSDRPDEKKLVLGALPKFPCPQALKIAETLGADPAVAAEAKLAADRIRRSLGAK